MSKHRRPAYVFSWRLYCIMLQQVASLLLPPWPPLVHIPKQLLQRSAPERLCECYLQTTKKGVYVGCLHTVNREGTRNKSHRRQDREESQYSLGAGHGGKGNRTSRDSQEPLETLGWMLSLSFPMRREKLFSHNFDPKFFCLSNYRRTPMLSGLYMDVSEFSQSLLMVIQIPPTPVFIIVFSAMRILHSFVSATMLPSANADYDYFEADPLGSRCGLEPIFAQCYFHDVKFQTRDYTLIMLTCLNGIHSLKQQLERSRTCK